MIVEMPWYGFVLMLLGGVLLGLCLGVMILRYYFKDTM